MTAAEIRDRFLIALRQESLHNGVVYYSVIGLAGTYGLRISSGFDFMLAEKLSGQGLVETFSPDSFDYDGDDARVKITWSGIEAAEQLLHASPEYGATVPASDRYVSLADNQREDLSDDFGLLGEFVRASNEASEEDRNVALSEIAAFEATIIQPRVATDLIQRFVDTVLGWITKVFSGALVGEVAKRLMDALMRLI